MQSNVSKVKLEKGHKKRTHFYSQVKHVNTLNNKN